MLIKTINKYNLTLNSFKILNIRKLTTNNKKLYEYITFLNKNSNYNIIQVNKNITYACICYKKLKFTTLHLFLSSMFKYTQLIDLCAYNIPLVKTNNINNYKFNNLIIYIFNSIETNKLLILLTPIKKNTFSIDNIFLNSSWLERESSEMNGIVFYSKIDTRNLLLSYNDITNPLIKTYTSSGIFEIFYNLIYKCIIKSTTVNT